MLLLATLAHSEAFSAIIVCHGYWVIFDPEVNPMNMTWRTHMHPRRKRLDAATLTAVACLLGAAGGEDPAQEQGEAAEE